MVCFGISASGAEGAGISEVYDQLVVFPIGNDLFPIRNMKLTNLKLILRTRGFSAHLIDSTNAIIVTRSELSEWARLEKNGKRWVVTRLTYVNGNDKAIESTELQELITIIQYMEENV